jgi:hypothetical protein
MRVLQSSCKSMTTQQVTIELPELIFRQLAQIADATQQSVEDLIAQSVVGNLPPSAENLPLDMQTEFLRMQTFSIEELLAIAQSQAESSQHQRHESLLEKNQDGLLSSEEQLELSVLRQSADRLMLRKAYAWSVLRWRGYRVPALKELVTPL